MIAVREGKHCCYSTTNGIRRTYSGCAHGTPREAIAHTANHPYVSPLRVERTGSLVTDGSSPVAVAEPARAPRSTGRPVKGTHRP